MIKKGSCLHFEDLKRDIRGNRHSLLHDELNDIYILKYIGFQRSTMAIIVG